MLYETNVLFYAGSAPLTGRIIRNTDDESQTQPVITITGSWLTVKEQMPQVYARKLAEAGYTCFIFDFAGFGQSDGVIKQFECPHFKAHQIKHAAAFIRTFSFAHNQPVIHLGVCASAQYSLLAIRDGAQIDAFCSVAGWYHNAQTVAPFYGGDEGVKARLKAADDATNAYNSTKSVITVPAYDPNDPNAAMFFELDYYGNPKRGAVPQWRNGFAVMSWRHWLTFDGLACAPHIRIPTLIFHSDDCVLPDNARAVHDAFNGPKDMVWSSGNQVDFYDLPDHVERAMAALLPWLDATCKTLR